MSVRPAIDPACAPCESTPVVETLIDGRPRDLGGFSVRRILPSVARRLVGPFIFLDHFGPVTMAPGSGMDVRPHPHINLATVTYLFEGEIVHRDSLGSHLAIRPGAINWMTAGRGIVHSERSSAEERARGPRLHGLQLWVALPVASEEMAPEFHHHAADTLPEVEVGAARARVLAGSAYGVTSPVETLSPLFYVEARLPAGAQIDAPAEHHDRAIYVVEGEVRCDGQEAAAGRMMVLTPGVNATVHATSDSRVALIGGEPLEGKRHIWWNFVSSRKERIEEAKRDWREGRLPKVPGDEDEYIPLPE
ncbi:MAG: pirin family protein [Myxococcales bacterium]|nr:pirin family protein [Myxococcales bacterium]